MTQHPLPPLDYASPRRPEPPNPGRGSTIWFVIALAVVAGFLGANTLADAAGFPVPDPNGYNQEGYIALRVGCGVVVALVSAIVLAFLIRQVANVAALLGRTAEKPSLAVALTLIICGTACILAAAGIQLYFARPSSGISIQAVAPGVQLGSVTAGIQPPLAAHIVTLLSFGAGAALVAVGVWSSIGRRATAPLTQAPVALPPPMAPAMPPGLPPAMAATTP